MSDEERGTPSSTETCTAVKQVFFIRDAKMTISELRIEEISRSLSAESSQHTGSCPPMGKLSIDLVESRVMKQRNHSPEITLLAPGRDR